MIDIQLEKLDEPFAAEDIEWRAQSCGKRGDRFWVKVLAYVTNRAIMKRLDDVCGKQNWKNEFHDVGKAIECGISIKIDGEWVTKWDAAEETNIEAVKGGRSGAMKRAAVQWGIGRYLYQLDEGWGNVSPNGKHSQKTKQGEWFKWDAPKLPAWALPQGSKPQAPQKPQGITPDQVLQQFTQFASSADAEALKSEFGKVFTALRTKNQPSKTMNEHQSKLKEVYDIRKNELQEQGNDQAS